MLDNKTVKYEQGPISALPRLTYTLNGATYTAGALTSGLESVTLVTEREENQRFYRTKWQGDLAFTGDDYKLFWQIHQKTCCQKVFISLYRTGQGCTTQTPPWKGFFSLSDVEFDTERCRAQLTEAPKPDDGYQTLIENWNKEVNWLDIVFIEAIYNATRTVLYRRGRSLTRLLADMTRFTLYTTPAESLIPTTGVDRISLFLESKTNPVTRRANPLLGALCLQASDVVAPGPPTGLGSQYGYSTRANLTLKELIDDLQELLCLYPYIDADTGKLRWEHESFFPRLRYDAPGADYDIPAASPAWAGHKTVKTDLSLLWGQYKLTIEPNVTIGYNHTLQSPGSAPFTTVPDFASGLIEFSDSCATRLPGETPLTKERSVRRIATDIGEAALFPDTVDRANWIFLVASSPSTDASSYIPQIPVTVVETSNRPVENGDLSASSLVRDFHRHNQPFSAGVFNKHTAFLPKGYTRSMHSISPFRQLGTVTLGYCCADTPIPLYSGFSTWLADGGVLLKAEYKVAQQLITLSLAHAGPCQILNIPDPFDPEETPSTCPPAGELLREEYTYEYFPGQSAETGSQPCAVTKGSYYSDGKCGEYSHADFISNGC